ncbi:MAG: FecR family protein [Kiloniellaceae bacterium]
MTAKHSLEAARASDDALLEEAVIWQSRLREPAGEALAAARAEAFQAWMAADQRHRQACKEAERLWAALDGPVAAVLAEKVRAQQVMARDSGLGMADKWGGNPAFRPARRSGGLVKRVAALAASLLVAVAAASLFYQDVVDALRGDLITAVGERAPRILADGSRVILNTDTVVALDLDGDRRRVELLRGEVWLEVSPDRARPFIVETPHGSVRVTGTRFDVRLEEDGAVVSLVEGRVELALPGAAAAKPPVVLAAGQQARLTHSGISAPMPFDATAVTAWVRGQFVFYDTPLAEVVAELNRYRTGRIVIADSELEALRVSGVFRTDDPDAALGVISDTLGVSATRLTDYLVLLY